MTLESLLSGLSHSEKLAAMEFLWQDLSSSPSSYVSPEWHQRVLAERLASTPSEPNLPLDLAIAEVRKKLHARRD